MFLLKTFHKTIEKSVTEYTRLVSEKYGIPEDELMEMWTDVTKMRMKTASGKSKRMSPWLRFCKEERVRMKTNDPTLKFGEISKRIGEKWSHMTSEERHAYLATIPEEPVIPTTDGATVTKKSSSSSKKTTTTTTAAVGEEVDPSLWTKENLGKMKIEELRAFCSKVQLSKSGKKSDLIDRLLKSIQYSAGVEGGWKKHEEDEDSEASEFDYASDDA